MRHKKDIRKLGRTKSHRKALIRNMLISFFQSTEIETTEAKAKELQRSVEKIITLGKKGDLASYRRINMVLNHLKIYLHLKYIMKKYLILKISTIMTILIYQKISQYQILFY